MKTSQYVKLIITMLGDNCKLLLHSVSFAGCERFTGFEKRKKKSVVLLLLRINTLSANNNHTYITIILQMLPSTAY